MSANREIRKVRCEDAIRILNSDNQAVFFTLTTPDEVGFDEIRVRWRHFRNSFLKSLRRMGKKPQYIMNYELHPGYLQKIVRDRKTVERVIHGNGRSHGWHIHGVISCFLPYKLLLRLANAAGFGRTDFRRVTSIGIYEYLTKHALKAYRGLTSKERETYSDMRLRLVNSSRGLPSLDSYSWDSDLIEVTREKMRQFRLDEIPEIDLRFRNYRVLHLYAEICAMLDFAHLCQVGQLAEWLNGGMRVLHALRLVRSSVYDDDLFAQNKEVT